MCRLRTAFGFLASVMLVLLYALPPADAQELAAWSRLDDADGSLQLNDVRERLSEFRSLPGQETHRPASEGAIWLYSRLPASDTTRILRAIAPNVAYIDFYAISADKVLAINRTGIARPGSYREQPSRDFLFTLPATTGALDVFIRLESRTPIRAFVKIAPNAEITIAFRLLMFGILMGCLCMLMLFNLLQLFYRRSNTGIALTLLLGLQISVAFNIFGLASMVLVDKIYLTPLLMDLCSLATVACCIYFTSAFFNGRQVTLRLNLLLCILFLALLLAAAFRLLTKDIYIGEVLYVLEGLTIITLCGISLRFWRQGFKPARWLALAYLLLIVAGLLAMPRLLGYWPSPEWLGRSLVFTSVVTGFLMSIAVGERQRYLQEKQFASSRDQAASTAEIKGKADFLARMSHEIRTPMNGVLGMTELLMGTSMSPKQRDYVQTIHSAGNELLALINEILDISRLESGKIELEDVQFDLNALIEDSLDIFRAKAEHRQVELISFIQPQVPRMMTGDPTRLRQVLLSLLDNAFLRTESGEILLVVALEGQDTPNPHLRIAVQDSGTPIEPEVRKRLTSNRLDSRDFLASGVSGAHRGLAITHRLILLMKGELGIESGSETGSTVSLTLPVPKALIDNPVADLDQPLQGIRLLMVDDNETCRKVLQLQCSAWGMNVTTAASGREALALLRTKANLQEYFDVVLLDQEMPGMTGMQLAARINEDPNLNHDLLLIMLTGITNAPSKIIARNAGIKRVLTKPVAGYTLKATLANELARRSRPLGDTPRETQTLSLPSNFKVLVAEDNSISTKVIRGMLKKLNIEPDTAANGLEALAAMQQIAYDLVLMDCEMPEMDGFTATERIRAWEKRENRPHTPIVALTAHILSEHKERAREVGMDGHMAKPIELSQLRDLLQYWARERNGLDIKK
ncbi:signal transduction histidine kinase [Pseudomonas duriflava]|uniref:histidine kinase n=1 Tax=Pseudomonas duriflava TaxID=459528 RepID=A0A562QNP9_9PSED|nr:hybrid sensor histidine kinase/response regulator [Pseudomonas duriflava]TWI58364.1 signal transduction histidine kinase [Pseudomonas duriflava]